MSRLNSKKMIAGGVMGNLCKPGTRSYRQVKSQAAITAVFVKNGIGVTPVCLPCLQYLRTLHRGITLTYYAHGSAGRQQLSLYYFYCAQLKLADCLLNVPADHCLPQR